MKRVAIAVALFGLLIAGLIAARPSTFEVVRTVTVAAPPAVAFEKLNQLHQWPAWSKWARDRVPASDAVSGPPSGAGSIWSWQPAHRDSRAGLEIVKITPPHQLVLKVFSDSPAQPELTFDLAPEGAGTRVTARFAGHLTLMGKLVSLWKSPETIIGPSLERELALFAGAVASP